MTITAIRQLVRAYLAVGGRKIHNVGFTIPYTINGEEHQYYPDFLTVLDDGHGPLDPLNLIIEVTGEKKKDKVAKVMTARTLWIPAVNNHGAFGRWAFLEVTDPYEVLAQIRSIIKGGASQKVGQASA